jgi:ADP-ribose pyrophosphatase YjhB (NUDIX family)
MTEPSFSRRVPPGDDMERRVCDTCGHIDYENPKIVVGSVASFGEKLLLVRRAIEPRAGYWTLPAGYLELNERPEDGACREAWEEARARIEIRDLLAVYAIPRISQIQLIYRAHLTAPEIEAGPESTDVGLFAWDDIPWAEIAFPSVHWALTQSREVRDRSFIQPFGNPEGATGDKPPGL